VRSIGAPQDIHTASVHRLARTQNARSALVLPRAPTAQNNVPEGVPIAECALLRRAPSSCVSLLRGVPTVTLLTEQLMVLITRIPAAGKSTVADLLARRFERGVHVKGDVDRRTVVAGRHQMTSAPLEEAW